MSDKCFVTYNGGLGDHILMSGAVRHFTNIYEEVHLMSFSRHAQNVEHLFRDEPKIRIHFEPNASSPQQSNRKVKKLVRRFSKEGCDIKSFYWAYMQHWPGCLERVGLDPNKNCWCEGFYRALGVDYYERYKSWKFLRDPKRENSLCEQLNLPNEYAFVVNRYGGGDRRKTFSLDIQKASYHDGLPHVNPAALTKQTLIFDWMKVIENATEIHVVDTGWMHLVKNMLLKQPKFLHRVARHVPASDANYLNDKHDTGWTDVRH